MSILIGDDCGVKESTMRMNSVVPVASSVFLCGNNGKCRCRFGIAVTVVFRINVSPLLSPQS